MRHHSAILLAPVIAVLCFAMGAAFLKTVTPDLGSTRTGPRALYPDPALTPGALNSGITQASIASNICNKSWNTSSIRPSSSYTTALKKAQIVEYGDTDTNTSSYEEDHLVSLELGGAPSDPHNLWPEPIAAAKEKDLVENYLHSQVCSGKLTLKQAQDKIIGDWYAVYLSIHSAPGTPGAFLDDSDPDDNIQ